MGIIKVTRLLEFFVKHGLDIIHAHLVARFYADHSKTNEWSHGVLTTVGRIPQISQICGYF